MFSLGTAEFCSFFLEKLARRNGRDFSFGNGLVKTDQVRIGVGQKRPLRSNVEDNGAGSEKRLNPSPAKIGGNRRANPRNKFCLDALALDGWNNDLGKAYAMLFLGTICEVSPPRYRTKSSREVIFFNSPDFVLAVILPKFIQ